MLQNIARRSVQCGSSAVRRIVTLSPASQIVAKKTLSTSRLSRLEVRPTLTFLLQQRSLNTSHQCWSEENTTNKTEYITAKLTEERFHRLSNEILEHITSKIEELMDESEADGYDVEYSQGVMTVRLGEHGTYVINKQPPNQQIWSSSPISGPLRFDYDEKHQKWFYHRDFETLDNLLNTELSTIFGRKVDLLEDFVPHEK
ncbi:Frataxin-like domain-containing protein [Mycotypha africana]|uniref:Frataxin-like domain-containing protein n=1 Tax=Mycotypha africana TaxID=64632 RepID=UPI002300DB13|nr:Frataxin-like domain-containing protein [Mycotypha africana]KAI8977043.1 Frataxin-like domain-containing protein [Mycotypha africana]